MHFLMTFINCHFFKDSPKGGARFFFVPSQTRDAHCWSAHTLGAAFLYDLHKIVVRIFEALTVGSSVHKAK